MTSVKVKFLFTGLRQSPYGLRRDADFFEFLFQVADMVGLVSTCTNFFMQSQTCLRLD